MLLFGNLLNMLITYIGPLKAFLGTFGSLITDHSSLLW